MPLGIGSSLSGESSEEATLANANSLYPLVLLQRSVVMTLVLTLSIAGYPAEALAAQDAAQNAAPVQVDTSPAGLDHLMAPIALYPDALLMQVLAGAVNSQEILDAGNWLLENKSLQGTQIDDAAKKLGFSAATTALLHFPEVVDQMCTNLDWTKQVGAAFSADQAGVLASIQRLRAQAQQYGTLKSTPQQTVQTQTDNGKQVIVIQPANPQVVYVPQYNPQTVYVQQSGPSTGDVVAASMISFGVGMAVGAIFANNNNYCYPRWGYGGVYYGGSPYYPAHYPYRPVYGPAFRPAYGYRPPANYPYHRANYNNNYYNNYRGGNNNNNNRNIYRGGNNTVNVNTGNNNNNNRPGNNNGYNKPGNGNNNNNNRPGNGNNNGYNKPGNGNNNNAGNNRPGGSNGYNKPANNANNRPGNNGGNSRPPTNSANRPAPDRGYAKPAGGNQAQARPGGGNQSSRPGGNQAQARPAPQAKPAQAQTRQAPAFSGGQSGKSANAASQRGAASAGGRKK